MPKMIENLPHKGFFLRFGRYFLLVIPLLVGVLVWQPWRDASTVQAQELHTETSPLHDVIEQAAQAQHALVNQEAASLTSVPRIPVVTAPAPLPNAQGEAVLPAYYQRYYDAVAQNDSAALKELLINLSVQDSYLEYLIVYRLAHTTSLPIAERIAYYGKIFALQIEEPLDRAGKRALSYDYAYALEQAENNELAILYYREALPLQGAQDALKRLAANRFRLANYFLQAKLYRQALEALDGEMVPSITAPSQRRLGNHEAALEAYEAWLAEEPTNISANFGKAWSLYYLRRDEEAEELFARYPNDSEALYARALLARRAGDEESALALLQRSGRGYDAWRAAESLDHEGHKRDALNAYLTIAAGSNTYADDAAYRAATLAQEVGDAEVEARATSLLPSLSYFRVLLGEPIDLALTEELEPTTPAVLTLAAALEQYGDNDAAIGELRFALRAAFDARDEASVLALGTALQQLGDFRQSQRYAERLVNAGSSERAIWRLAYPLAYPRDVRTQAARVGIPPQLIWAIMFQESRFYPRAVSHANAKGLMQFMPSTWDWMAELLDEDPADPFTPAASIRYGATYLAWLVTYFEAYQGSFDLVVPSYNGGQGYIKRLFESARVGADFKEYYHRIDKTETREYLEQVMRAYHIYEALYDL